MELALALLADFANKSADGKLNILGAFNRIFAEKFPAVHTEMKLVLRFSVHPAETGETKKIKIQLRTDTGQVKMEIEGEMKLPRPPRITGEMLTSDQILGINGLQIEAAGRYEFVVFVNGEVKGSAPFTASARQPRKAPDEEGRREGT